MKGAPAATLAAAILALQSAASADVTLNLGSGTVSGGQSLPPTNALLTGTLTAYTIEFDYVTGPGSWASDLLFGIRAANNTGHTWGGYNFTPPGYTHQGFWAFDGGGSAPSGHYSDTQASSGGLNGTGNWMFTVWNGYLASGPVEYNNIIVTLVGVDIVPAPGALALLGVAGLVSARRRRTA